MMANDPQEPAEYSAQMPCMHPHDDSAIEWWFVQGRIQGPGVGARHIMAVIFRINGIEDGSAPGAMLIQHVLDEATGQTWFESRVTPETAGHHDQIAACVARAGFPPILRNLALWRHRADNASWVRSSGVVVDTQRPVFSSTPFSVSWNGFALTESADGLHGQFKAGPDETAQLELTPQSAWLDERSERLHPDLIPGFSYQCCPRIRATGTVGSIPVEGQFWMDRQWGRYEDWLLAPAEDGYRVLGWDWFGINIEDGRDLLLCRHRDAARQDLLCQWGVVFEGGLPALAGPVTAQPHRHWTSPRSGARYPVDWSLDCPELGLNGRVEAVLDDQEIPVYGTVAIWEGAARFTGMQGGRAVSGNGRLELVGYGAPLTVPAHLQRGVTRFAHNLSAFLRLPSGI